MEPERQRDAEDDLAVVKRVLGGARHDFTILVRRHNQRLYRAARGIVKDDGEAEDAVQQAWMAVFRNLRSYRGDAAFSTWITRIAVNEALTRVRRVPVVAEATDEHDTGDGPDEQRFHQELGAHLERHIERLPQGLREVLVLREVVELDTAETASCLGITEEAVRVRLHRARAAVATSLSQVLSPVGSLYSFAGARCDRITAWVAAAIEREPV
ncbi:MAG TPA: RNA polymerase sigma factor [Kofleriaceae bacterium]|nr:RNA polymerase sigma factor [Kofleriaceae bacterium]